MVECVGSWFRGRPDCVSVWWRGALRAYGCGVFECGCLSGMNAPLCPVCHGPMKKNGSTSSGRTRWRCKDRSCGASRTRSYDRRAADLGSSLAWLLSKDTQEERPVPARTLRRRNELMWALWPPVPLADQVHDVVHLDGIHLHRRAVVLIAIAGGHVIGWYVARRETSAAWSCLMARIAPPLAVVCDGGGGLLKALRDRWPDTRVQRCLFHVCMNITELTGVRPRLEAGKRLRRVAVALSRVHDADSAAAWMASYNQWERDFAGFLGEKSEYRDGTIADQHARLVKARRMIRRRIAEGHMFAFLKPPEGCAAPIPPTNNLIESWNAGIRDMLRRHRGLRLVRRIKAICWWCHSRTERPEPASWLVRNAITDQRIEELYKHAWETSPQGAWETYGIPMRYGTGIDWNEFHTPVRHPDTTE